MINRAIRELVIERAGTESWNTICSAAGMDTNSFNDSTYYDDSTTYDLVEAASTHLGWSPEEVLRSFGRHWILFTGREGWGSVFELTGDTLSNFVSGLDELHTRVQVSMAGSVMPSFTVREDLSEAGTMVVEYRSERSGLEHMVVGLFEGLAEHFDEAWQVELLGPIAGDAGHTFRLSPSPEQASASTR